MNYVVHESPELWFQSKNPTLLMDVLLTYIHSFRMPTFFLTAGFFAAMLYRKKGLAETLRNRAGRILLPFVIFWPILYIIVASLMLATAHIMELGEWGFDLSLV